MSNIEVRNSVDLIKCLSEASPPAWKPMKSTGWKRARRRFSAYASESDFHHSSIFNRHSSFQVVSYKSDDLIVVEAEGYGCPFGHCFLPALIGGVHED